MVSNYGSNFNYSRGRPITVPSVLLTGVLSNGDPIISLPNASNVPVPEPVPEPGTVLLVGLGVLALRKRRRA